MTRWLNKPEKTLTGLNKHHVTLERCNKSKITHVCREMQSIRKEGISPTPYCCQGYQNEPRSPQSLYQNCKRSIRYRPLRCVKGTREFMYQNSAKKSKVHIAGLTSVNTVPRRFRFEKASITVVVSCET